MLPMQIIGNFKENAAMVLVSQFELPTFWTCLTVIRTCLAAIALFSVGIVVRRIKVSLFFGVIKWDSFTIWSIFVCVSLGRPVC